MKASAEAAKRESEKNWEGDLWSDDEGDTTAAAAAATATGAGDSAKHARDEEGMAEACAPPRKKRKPDSKLQLQLRWAHSATAWTSSFQSLVHPSPHACPPASPHLPNLSPRMPLCMAVGEEGLRS